MAFDIIYLALYVLLLGIAASMLIFLASIPLSWLWGLIFRRRKR